MSMGILMWPRTLWHSIAMCLTLSWGLSRVELIELLWPGIVRQKASTSFPKLSGSPCLTGPELDATWYNVFKNRFRIVTAHTGRAGGTAPSLSFSMAKWPLCHSSQSCIEEFTCRRVYHLPFWIWNFVIASARGGGSINWPPTTPCSPHGDVSCKLPLAPQRGHRSSPRPDRPHRQSSYTAPTCNSDQELVWWPWTLWDFC